jgi:hypothetical protein
LTEALKPTVENVAKKVVESTVLIVSLMHAMECAWEIVNVNHYLSVKKRYFIYLLNVSVLWEVHFDSVYTIR